MKTHKLAKILISIVVVFVSLNRCLGRIQKMMLESTFMFFDGEKFVHVMSRIGDLPKRAFPNHE